MFKHILVATDGSKLSQKAIRTAAGLARSTGARLTGAYVIPPYSPPVYTDAMVYAPVIPAGEYRQQAKRAGQKALSAGEREARSAKVAWSEALLAAPSAWEGIIAAAKKKKCDLIVMASHGRRGLSALLLGSETAKVLTHSKIPVLVCR
jgi:nucleotide-binding universal stress UspA family protein